MSVVYALRKKKKLSVENGCHCQRCVCFCSSLFSSVFRYLDTDSLGESRELSNITFVSLFDKLFV